MTTPVISVVDDDASVRRSLVRLFRSCGLAAEAFESAEGFLAGPHDGDVACVILDVHMGGMSGIELSELISASPDHPPVIIMTAHDDESTKHYAATHDLAGFLRKPFESGALLEAVGRAIHRDLQY
ncbi:MAG: response regulator [Blastocatellia bacterium]|nr:response regulator [Blastocatellia bacterium]